MIGILQQGVFSSQQEHQVGNKGKGLESGQNLF
jgi:hypothetical protein